MQALGVKDQTSTHPELNRLRDFRQAVYAHGYTRQKDAQWELCDALLTLGSQPSPAYLSQAPCFRRQWSSVYSAIEDGRQDTDWVFGYLVGLVEAGARGVQYFALDTSSWVRKAARTLAERGYVHQATNAVKGGKVSVGYAYSFLTWISTPHSSWALPVHERRVLPTENALSVGVQQVQWLSQQRHDCPGLDLVVADGTYGTCHFLGPLRDQARVGLLVRLAKHRVLKQAPPPRQPGQRGRMARHGADFAFKRPETWPPPAEHLRWTDPLWGQVELQRWNHLHDEHDWQTPFDVVRAQVHLEQATHPDPLWLAWRAPQPLPDGLTVDARFLWQAFQMRWPTEPHFRFRKQTLMWTRPRWLTPAACDRWSVLVDLACWQLFLARTGMADCPLPWQPPQTHLTPQRVQQGFARYFPLLGSPAQPPQPRGNSPGWPVGQPRAHRPRCPTLPKG